ncbi:hypothetical protein [Corticicoccus populi]|uniref:Uncharacterized protein n=1 Tax=Corticicoccus populi TaxID=1812821 RepID=A0ABW5X0T4_9STAP
MKFGRYKIDFVMLTMFLTFIIIGFSIDMMFLTGALIPLIFGITKINDSPGGSQREDKT